MDPIHYLPSSSNLSKASIRRSILGVPSGTMQGGIVLGVDVKLRSSGPARQSDRIGLVRHKMRIFRDQYFSQSRCMEALGGLGGEGPGLRHMGCIELKAKIIPIAVAIVQTLIHLVQKEPQGMGHLLQGRQLQNNIR